ncbi:uncharacterized protein PGTG_13618 [Puccinia graminis f. sp. tritici CRL 75-36-700-3]|uniref:Uncharacterized protein n=1 Tax=Puccinia graminis f. sp. tritici (strain CRL 75-36-700-3 / race SCCL) TaxID=418459 RepID=E3KT04_PUCGT|nr:uncharacterized protein PGTG_13618 [Puccinia graminis f. sp. tritici CRL 75-36-700-3]EFP87390.1 hypothetical protein PGTG_13618 [Puccinia graminis f. sp. tritici CRL 75-36-700-3]
MLEEIALTSKVLTILSELYKVFSSYQQSEAICYDVNKRSVLRTKWKDISLEKAIIIIVAGIWTELSNTVVSSDLLVDGQRRGGERYKAFFYIHEGSRCTAVY